MRGSGQNYQRYFSSNKLQLQSKKYKSVSKPETLLRHLTNTKDSLCLSLSYEKN